VHATRGDRAPRDLPDVLQFMQRLWAVSHGLETASRRMTVELGVTGPQRLVLRVVGLFPGLSAGDLATILHVHPSTLTGVLRRLVAHRLLMRVDDPRDRRRAVLRLTPQGLSANAVSRGTVEAAVAGALEGLTSRDRGAARRVLEELARHLDGTSAFVRDALLARTSARPRRSLGGGGSRTEAGRPKARHARSTPSGS
jgi:DNA-binding MarR family transcriptional regulator